MSPVRAARRAALTALAVGAVLAGGAGPAWANHAEVIGSADCSGTVAYTVTAWPGQPSTPEQPARNERSRTIDDLALEVSLDDGPFRTAVEHLSLGKDNGYSVTGTFTLPGEDLPDRLVLRSVPVSKWATGAPGVARNSPVLDLSRCEGKRVAAQGSSGNPDRRPLWLGGGLLGALAAWFVTRPREGAA
jgi:hypothetical protein